jgi:hypothetical protein
MNINIGESLIESIKSKDAQRALSAITQYRDSMKTPAIGADYVMWLTEPVNLTSVHKALAEDLNVPPKLLAIRRSSIELKRVCCWHKQWNLQ